jgi:hypothetical protein
MKVIVLVSAFMFFGSAAAAAPSGSLSASIVAAEIQSVGTSSVLRKYYDTPAWSKSIIPGIRSAAPTWLSVAMQLHTVSDAGASGDLDLALYAALAVAPFRVLPLLSKLYGSTVDDLCNVSFEAEVPKPGVSASEYLAEIRAKLADVHTDAEKVMAASCAHGLDRSAAAAKAQGLR